MAFLEVKVKTSNDGNPIATYANGISLAKSNGCLYSIFFGSKYPLAWDYFSGLEHQGWSLDSSKSSRIVGMIDGLPFANSEETYLFRGTGLFEIDWDEEGWFFY